MIPTYYVLSGIFLRHPIAKTTYYQNNSNERALIPGCIISVAGLSACLGLYVLYSILAFV